MVARGARLRRKIATVPATEELMGELARYRHELSYFPYPVPGESTPLLLPIEERRSAVLHFDGKFRFNPGAHLS